MRKLHDTIMRQGGHFRQNHMQLPGVGMSMKLLAPPLLKPLLAYTPKRILAAEEAVEVGLTGNDTSRSAG